MRNTLKKVTAGLLAMTLTICAVPAQLETDILQSSITASAMQYQNPRELGRGYALDEGTQIVDTDDGALFRIFWNGIIKESSTLSYIVPEDCYVQEAGSADGLILIWLTTNPLVREASVTLADDLAMNFYFANVKESEADDYTVVFTGKCAEEGKVLNLNRKEDGRYFISAHIFANNMREYINLKLYNKQNEPVDEINFNMMDYLRDIRHNEAPQKTRELIAATKTFGEAADNYFNGANHDLSLPDYQYISGYAPDFEEEDPENAPAKLSLVLDSKTAIRLYEKGLTADHSSDDGDTPHKSSKLTGDYEYYYEVAGLLPQEFADIQTIMDAPNYYNFSALSWCYRALTSEQAAQKDKDLARAVIEYYKAAKTYVTNADPTVHQIDLYTLESDYVAQDGDILTGTLKGNYQIEIADGATVTLKDVTIQHYSESDNDTLWAGIMLQGDATIMLEGNNYVAGMNRNCPGIYVPEGKTLTFSKKSFNSPEGSLTAETGRDKEGHGRAAGIGAGRNKACGNIVVKAGTIYAYGGEEAAGLGGASYADCGDITLNGGMVVAKGGLGSADVLGGAGIGSGTRANCGKITIEPSSATLLVNAQGGQYAPGIGASLSGATGDIYIKDVHLNAYRVVAMHGEECSYSVTTGPSSSTVRFGEIEGAISDNPFDSSIYHFIHNQ